MSAEGSPLRLRADRAALGCVIWNLLENAVKYSPDCRHHLGGAGPGRPATWRSGCVTKASGFRRASRKLIFRKFTRGAAAKTGGIRGAGVGCPMARQIADAHGGEITVESRTGEGSTFTVLLPERE